jgi:hypothetical protein
MPSFFNKLKGAFTSPSTPRKGQSHSQTPPTSARGGAGASSTTSMSQPIVVAQVYANVKEKELPKLHAAAWRGDLDKVTELCRPDKLNIFDKDGRSALHLAIAANHFKVAEQLLTEDARYQLDRESRSPLVVVRIFSTLFLSNTSKIISLFVRQRKLAVPK